jgi:hypothetical protein
MIHRWFKFTVFDAEEEFGLGTEEEAFEYAAIMNEDCDGEPCKPILLNERRPPASLSWLRRTHS